MASAFSSSRPAVHTAHASATDARTREKSLISTISRGFEVRLPSAEKIGAKDASPAFVAMLSNGTSGDANCIESTQTVNQHVELIREAALKLRM